MGVWDIKGLSKDLVDGLITKAGKQKDVLLEALVQEISKYLRSIDISTELNKALDNLTVNINATIELKRKGGGSHKMTKNVHISGGHVTKLKPKSKKKAHKS